MKLTGFTVSEKGGKPSLIVSYKVMDKDENEDSINRNVDDQDRISRMGGDMDALVIDMPGGEGVNLDILPNDSIVNYWRFVQTTE
jgi:hypothetical protein